MSGATFKCPRRGETAEVFNYATEDHWRKDGTCSYCGSISPDAFFAAVEAGEEIGPTDKSYKAYVFPAHRKFYFQHLGDEERRRFIELNNSGAMKLAAPGFFYTTPFFAKVTSHDYEVSP